MGCWQEPALGAMWAQVHSEWLLTQRLAAMEHRVSDAALQQLPEFKQRVAVLRSLAYIDDLEVVQMKVQPPELCCDCPGAVACGRTWLWQ